VKLSQAKYFEAAFGLGLLLKGAFALAEIGAGLFIYFANRHFLLALAHAVTRMELMGDPHDFVANHLLHAAQNLSVSDRHFTAFYLISHGVIKLWLIIGLLRKRLAYYPAAMIVFGLFIVYQMYRYSFTGSISLLFITGLDLVVIWLTLLEYRHLGGIVKSRTTRS